MDDQLDALDKCPHCESLVYSEDFKCPNCGKDMSEVEGHQLSFDDMGFNAFSNVDVDLARDIKRGK